MPLTRETVELLAQVARAWYFEGDRHGLRNREWMALRFLARANRFSRTPSELARFLGATKATATQIVKALEEKSYLVRSTSRKDKRSIVLCVTSQGEKFLERHDPINHALNAIAARDADECLRLRDTLKQILNHLDEADHRVNASTCKDCMFLTEHGPSTIKRRASAEFMCRLHRASISRDEIELLCTSFESARSRSKMDETRPANR